MTTDDGAFASIHQAVPGVGDGHRARRIAAALAVTVFVADQVSKELAVRLLDGSTRSWGPVRLGVIHNTGGPFGLAAGATAVWVALSIVGGVFAIAGVLAVRRLDGFMIGIAVIAGGVFGNLVDRLARVDGLDHGAVVDWLRVDPYPRVFNLADVALRGGAVVALVASIGARRSPSRTT